MTASYGLELLNHQYPQNSLVLESGPALGIFIYSPETSVKPSWIHSLGIFTFLRPPLNWISSLLASAINQPHA